MEEKIKETPQSLAVSDLQLFVAFHLRKGIDLTSHMRQEDDGGFVIKYTPDTEYIFDSGISLIAKFDKDGCNIFVKYQNQSI